VRAAFLRHPAPGLARGKVEFSIAFQPEDRMFNMDHPGQLERRGMAARPDRSTRKGQEKAGGNRENGRRRVFRQSNRCSVPHRMLARLELERWSAKSLKSRMLRPARTAFRFSRGASRSRLERAGIRKPSARCNLSFRCLPGCSRPGGRPRPQQFRASAAPAA
jgi:hypothetical protein